ncbi:MAG: GNAT family protein [Bacteroidota bacterium]|nr:GNAT family protein [Bacteroidota bacterium]
MVKKTKEDINLRALEPSDIDFLFNVENDIDLWKYSNRSTPYSKHILSDYIKNSSKDIFESRQIKFAISDSKNKPVGFIDLYDFEPMHRRAAIGLVVDDSKRSMGIGSSSLRLIEEYAKNQLFLHQLYANIASENTHSIKLFKKHLFVQSGKRIEWNYYDGKYHDEYIFQKII